MLLRRHKHHQAMLWATRLGNAGFILILAGACLACRNWDTSPLPFLAPSSWTIRPWLWKPGSCKNASRSDAAGKERPGVVVFSGTLAHDGSKAVAKVPRSNLIRLEVKS